MLKRSLLANYVGQGASALMSFAFIPEYIRYLGLDAYGLIGIYAIFQTALNFLSVGLSPLLSREVAISAQSSDFQPFRTLLRSSEILLSVILALTISVALISSPIAARYWLSSSLPAEDLILAIIFMVLLASLRVIESFYGSILLGLQHQLTFNCIQVASVFLRSVGVLAVLNFISPTIHVFLGWQLIIAFITVIFYAQIGYLSLPPSNLKPQFSFKYLRSKFRFVGGVAGVTLVSMLLTQSDKIILSANTELSDFGIYALATTMAGTLILLVTPISQAFFPRFCYFHSARDIQGFSVEFHLAAQITTLVCAPLFFTLFLFASPLTLLWTNDQSLTASIVPIFRILLVGTFFNCMLIIPAQCYYASGLITPLLRITGTAFLVLLPALLLTIPFYHSYAAAISWLLLNLGLFLFQIKPLFNQLLKGHGKDWYFRDILFPSAFAILAPYFAYKLFSMYQAQSSGLSFFLLIIALSFISSAWMALLSMAELRHRLRSHSAFLAKII